MTKFYGLRPVDIDDMTLREVSEYRTQMHAYLTEEKQRG